LVYVAECRGRHGFGLSASRSMPDYINRRGHRTISSTRAQPPSSATQQEHRSHSFVISPRAQPAIHRHIQRDTTRRGPSFRNNRANPVNYNIPHRSIAPNHPIEPTNNRFSLTRSITAAHHARGFSLRSNPPANKPANQITNTPKSNTDRPLLRRPHERAPVTAPDPVIETRARQGTKRRGPGQSVVISALELAIGQQEKLGWVQSRDRRAVSAAQAIDTATVSAPDPYLVKVARCYRVLDRPPPRLGRPPGWAGLVLGTPLRTFGRKGAGFLELGFGGAVKGVSP
jgi:hypothetical protein